MSVDVKEVLTLKGLFTQNIMSFLPFMAVFCGAQRKIFDPFFFIHAMIVSGVQTLKKLWHY